jgi:hypothetical protein
VVEMAQLFPSTNELLSRYIEEEKALDAEFARLTEELDRLIPEDLPVVHVALCALPNLSVLPVDDQDKIREYEADKKRISDRLELIGEKIEIVQQIKETGRSLESFGLGDSRGHSKMWFKLHGLK